MLKDLRPPSLVALAGGRRYSTALARFTALADEFDRLQRAYEAHARERRLMPKPTRAPTDRLFWYIAVDSASATKH